MDYTSASGFRMWGSSRYAVPYLLSSKYFIGETSSTSNAYYDIYPIDLAAAGLTPWQVTINNGSDATQLTCTRSDVSGLTAVYNNGYLYLPAAWSENWSCTVNGKKEPLIRTLGALSAVEIPEGGADVKLSFLPKGMKTGALLTAAGAVMLILLLILFPRDREWGRAGRAAEKALYVISGATVFVCFIAAPVVWAAVNIIDRVVRG